MRQAQESLKPFKKKYIRVLKAILQYIRNYLRDSDKKQFIRVSIFCGLLIFFNYYFQLYTIAVKNNSFPVKLIIWTAVFMVALIVPVYWSVKNRKTASPLSLSYYLFLVIAPVLFAIKCSLSFRFPFSYNNTVNQYWNTVIYWPLLGLIMLLLLLLARHFILKDKTDFGTGRPMNSIKPYILMLLLMLPFIVFASTQADFQSMYPKLYSATGGTASSWQALLFELSYGTDFITIELFFRGFMVFSLARWLGKEAILPVAVFYCSIHFGKPLAECISSYFGGILLGIIVYHTRSIRGGLLVHLGIAWMMEIAGILVRS